MAENRILEHVIPTLGDLKGRVEAQQYDYRTIGENIAYYSLNKIQPPTGNFTFSNLSTRLAQIAYTQWINSKSHEANIGTSAFVAP
jgi:uncharacterized protein YkwD